MDVLGSALSGIFIAEIVCLILAIITLIFMRTTRPRATHAYRLNYIGIISSIVTIVFQLFNSMVAYYSGESHEWITRVFVFVFLISFCVTLDLVYAYVYTLSYKNKQNNIVRDRVLSVFNLAYFICAVYVLIGENVVHINGTEIKYDGFVYFYLVFGIIDALICMITCTKAKNDIPKMIYRYLIQLFLGDIVIIFLHLLYKETIFSPVTYVFPFVIFYILFHSNPIDENSGCRNESSFENEFNHRKNKPYVLVNIYLPRNKNSENEKKDTFLYLLADKCRKFELLDPSIAIYYRNSYTYNVFVDSMDDSKLENLLLRMESVLIEDNNVNGEIINFNYKMIVTVRSDFINSVEDYNSFLKMIDKKYFQSSTRDEIYIVTNEDYEQFNIRNNIAKALWEIRNTQNLEDERVLCYAQPIYEASTNSFNTAEALMRMKIGDKFITPDVFIPLAEELNCIHPLTLVMLNKVCKAIKELEKEYTFEAITVNGSTMEFDNLNFSNEVIEIIEKNNVDTSKVRIELTENDMAESYKNILINMKWMMRGGIYCYLDDFGTGYSNLERIFNCPFMTIKFDKSVLYTALEDANMEEIMVSMIEAFKKKGYHVLVEGVETEAMRDFCLERGFEYLQGYLYSKPVPIEDLRSFFNKKNKVYDV